MSGRGGRKDEEEWLKMTRGQRRNWRRHELPDDGSSKINGRVADHDDEAEGTGKRATRNGNEQNNGHRHLTEES